MKEPNLRNTRFNKELTEQIRKSFAGKKKTRITIYIDDDALREVRKRAAATGGAYQSILNHLLRREIFSEKGTSVEARLSRIERELAKIKKKMAA